MHKRDAGSGWRSVSGAFRAKTAAVVLAASLMTNLTPKRPSKTLPNTSPSALMQRTLYEDDARIAVRLPLGDELGVLHPGGCFPLLEDPICSTRACLVGMFVLRPATVAWTGPVIGDDGFPASMYDARQWCFNVRGTQGGAWISAGNALDAYRLALHYGISDAVIVGSGTVAKEGVARGGSAGYLWQPYGPARWQRLSAIDSGLAAKILRLREQWQRMGVLSSRAYPAQVVVSQSGGHHEGAADILDADIFSRRHPDGSAIEAYVLSSEDGAQRLAERARARGLGLAIGRDILALSPPGQPAVLDVQAVPRLLRERLDVRIADHDGGAVVLSKFSAAGALTQLNVTLMRDRCVREVVERSDGIEEGQRNDVLASFDDRVQLLFPGDGRLPPGLRPAYVIGSDGEAVVVTFDVRGVSLR